MLMCAILMTHCIPFSRQQCSDEEETGLVDSTTKESMKCSDLQDLCFSASFGDDVQKVCPVTCGVDCPLTTAAAASQSPQDIQVTTKAAIEIDISNGGGGGGGGGANDGNDDDLNLELSYEDDGGHGGNTVERPFDTSTLNPDESNVSDPSPFIHVLFLVSSRTPGGWLSLSPL